MATTRKTTRQTRLAAEKVRHFNLAEEKSREYPSKTAAVVEVTCGNRLVGYNVRFDTNVLVDGDHIHTPVAAFQDGKRLF